METDIVCGMYLINTENCKVSEYKGQKYYFCCDTCKEEFDSNKVKYVNVKDSNHQKKSTQEKSQIERDPVCGQMINIKDARGTSFWKDNKYYFCCVTCKKVFDNMPSAYADKEEGFYDPNNPNDFLDGRFRIL